MGVSTWRTLRVAPWMVSGLLASACSDDSVALDAETSTGVDATSTGDPTTSDLTTSGPTTGLDTSEGTDEGSSSSETGETCGDGIIDGDESCDGEQLAGHSCGSLRLGSGTLACTSECTFDVSGCTARSCGDGAIEGAEVCDGLELDGQDCVSQGFEAGLLACAMDCSAYDTTSCLFVPECVEQDIGSAVGPAVASGSTLTEDPDFVPSCTGQASPASVLLWVAPAAGLWAFDTAGSSFDTVLSLHSDCGEGWEEACGFDWGQGAQVILALEAGDALIIQVTGYFNTVDWVLSIEAVGTGSGGCCYPSGGLGCSDEVCQQDVCAALPGCCQWGWSDQCASVAEVFCDVCNTPDICGNGTAEMGETCDGIDFAGQSCETEGFDGGALACPTDCSGLDTSGCFDFGGSCCAGHSGPGCVDEACAADVCATAPWCCDFGWDYYCAQLATEQCDVCNTPNICGNGVLDGTDVCDAPDVSGEDCVSQGFDGGELGCLDDCTGFDTSGCFDFGGDCCADHATPGCDDPTCSEQVCGADPFCCQYQWYPGCADLANTFCAACGVPPGCGNSLVEDAEVCDGADLEGQSCADFGFDGGYLGCMPDCTGFDLSGCFDYGGECCAGHAGPGCDDGACAAAVCELQPWCCDVQWEQFCADVAANECEVCGAFGCGDGFIEVGESCDGANLDGQTCVSQGFDIGVLACAADCSFDTSGCQSYGGDCCAAHGGPGCDNVACTAQVCATNPACCSSGWDQSCADTADAICNACDPGVCGNGSIEQGEVCDGADLDAESCVSLGFDVGTLGCAGDCLSYDTSSCLAYTGDCCDPAGDDTPGCEDAACTATVCAADPSCCSGDWTPACSQLANESCAACGAFFDFSGVLNDVPEASLVGWEQCYVDTYAVSGAPLADILELCDEANLLMGCREAGTTTLLVAANAPRTDVLFDTDMSNTPHDANGVGWYYDPSYSWGFAPQGLPIQRDNCDIVDSVFLPGTGGEQRVCWSTFNETLVQGWRCGAADQLDFSVEYERVLYQRP